ncbi:DUF11 domain-containing protein [Candidatus Saccharibacteria bacterium]|nr:DUF11 domain-containing protein [Candidatus Saccharibacteria bacterium]
MKKFNKMVLGLSAAAVIVAAVSAPVIVSAWGDNANGRETYTLEQLNNEEFQKQFGDKITFNSITNNEKFGDERNFVGAKVAGANVATWNANTIKVKDGETYTIRLYVHNNSPKGEQAIAKGVKANFSLPTTVAKSQTIIGYINSSNATPTRYWDEVTLEADENVYLEYVEGSAKYTNNIGEFKLPNEVVTTGATLGYKTMNGEIPGCYGYSGVVTIDVKVHSSVAAKVSKVVRLKGTKTWSESVEAKVGDEVEYQIEYVNLLAETVKNVAIRDVLPTNVEYVPGTTYLYNASHQNGVLLEGDHVTTTGIIIGDYASKGNAYVRFTGKVVDKTIACGDNQLVNWASATVSSSTVKNAVYKDDASVMVKKDDESCKEKPAPTEEEPTPTPTPVQDNPGTTPKTIVSTGPETIVTGAIGAGAVVTTLGYYVASRKKLM